MKTAPRLALSVAVATLALGCAPRKPPPLDTRRFPVVKDLPPLGTGQDLLRAEVLPPKKPYRVGDKLEVGVRLTNVSDRPLIIARSIEPLGFEGRRIPLYDLRLLDRHGRVVPFRATVTFIDPHKSPVLSKHRVDLRPGASYIENIVLYERRLMGGKIFGELGYDINRPGKYVLSFRFACIPDSRWSLGSPQYEWLGLNEAWRREKAAWRPPECWRPPEWLKNMVCCHIAAKPAVLRVLPGTPREALQKWKPPPRPKPIKPEVFFGRRYVPAGFIEKGNPIPKATREKLERQFDLEFSADDTLGKAVEHLKQYLPLSADAESAKAKLGTKLLFSRRPAGDCLYWLARLTETSLVLRGSELVFVKKVPASGAIAVCEHYLPAKRFYPGDEHPAVRGLSKRITLEFTGQTVAEALEFLWQVSDVPIVIAPSVAGRKLKTIKMENVPIKKVLDAVVAAAGCDYEVRRGLIYVYPKKKPAGTPKK